MKAERVPGRDEALLRLCLKEPTLCGETQRRAPAPALWMLALLLLALGLFLLPARAQSLHVKGGAKAATVVDYAKPDRAPLLLIAGGRDHIVPSAVVYENFNRYRRSAAPTDFKLFQPRPHLTAALDGWTDVADYALTWTAGRTR